MFHRMPDDPLAPFPTNIGPLAENLFLKVARRLNGALIIPLATFRQKQSGSDGSREIAGSLVGG